MNVQRQRLRLRLRSGSEAAYTLPVTLTQVGSLPRIGRY
jgi:hypothetical protein